ncbi:MAG: MarR family winged helix-turn-helix transcriptional regulator [Magnetospiraceae bacterium]
MHDTTGTHESVDQEELREAIELLFFAYRDFTAGPDAVLAEYGFGRAHHRVIYFVNRHPGIAVGELLCILQITKQSLAPVLKTLVQKEFIRQETGERDKRKRELFLTEKGAALERELSVIQKDRLQKAFAEAGAEAVAGFRAVMRRITDERERFDQPLRP